MLRNSSHYISLKLLQILVPIILKYVILIQILKHIILI